jgi:hypothetical protein
LSLWIIRVVVAHLEVTRKFDTMPTVRDFLFQGAGIHLTFPPPRPPAIGHASFTRLVALT